MLSPLPRTNRRFKFQKRSQYFISTHNETLSVAMRINNPDYSPLAIYFLLPICYGFWIARNYTFVQHLPG